MESMTEYVKDVCVGAKKASPSLARLSTQRKNDALAEIAKKIVSNTEKIIQANMNDLSEAEKNGVPPAMLDRLMLNSERIEKMASSIRELIGLADPIGNGEHFTRPNGLEITKVNVPLGVVAIIYESRPNVTVDAASLCLKTGNAVVLRGGKEAISTNRVLVSVMRDALAGSDIDPNAISFIDDPSREGSAALMMMRGYIDVLIPRGGRGLIRSVVENSRVPVIETGAGNCHMFIDDSADLEMAVKVALNAKVSRPSVCNAIETLLVHTDIAAEFLPVFFEAIRPYNVELRGDELTASYIACTPVTEEDYGTEYDDYILAIKIVKDVNEAIEHIEKYSTGHSESIITRSLENAHLFQKSIDSAAVYVNASTRFTDGGEFGFGAEIGISTQKLHARGPMGLSELTTVKYLINGDGQVR